MQKIVVDTNVLVSALISEGIPALIIKEHVLLGKVQICISDAVLEEYPLVLGGKKFSKYLSFRTDAEIVLERIEEIALKFSPNVSINLISDESDNKFLELSIAAQVDYLITGNTNDFTESQYQDVKVVSPREYWDKLRLQKIP